MTAQPRDLAAEAAEISRIHDEGRYDQYGEHPAESIGTLLDYIAALSRELTELRRPLADIRKEGEVMTLQKYTLETILVDSDGNAMGHDESQAFYPAGAVDDEFERLSSPPEERAEIAERQHTRKQIEREHGQMFGSATADIDTLLQDLARARNALDDRVRMLGIVQDALSERNRENVELRAKCERLEKESINADGDLQLRDERIERLEGALQANQMTFRGMEQSKINLLQRIGELEPALRAAIARMEMVVAAVDLEPEMCAMVSETIQHCKASSLAAADGPALAASQHTAGSGDGVAGD